MELASQASFAENPERVIDWYNWRRGQLAEERTDVVRT